MKHILNPLRFLAALTLIAFILPGCLKDKVTHTYRIYTPVYKTTAEVRANIKSNVSQNITKPGKLFLRGQYIFLNEIDRGIHIIDNSNPSSPKNVAFIDIPGNMDLAVKGNILYADLYSDLVALDISNPLQVSVKKIIESAFPERLYTNGFIGDKNRIIVDWKMKDTTVRVGEQPNNWNCANCLFDGAALQSASYSGGKSSPFGVGGSMARFSVVKNSLYTVSDAVLNVYSITTPESPVTGTKLHMGWGIETIYPFKDKLFIGSTTGMFIYDVSNESSPKKLGQFSHVTACDPVIADDNYAFVTLRNGVRCSNGANQLDVLDIANLTAPSLIKSYNLTSPHGLSKDGDDLFICDGKDGLKIFDASDVKNIKLKTHLTGFETYDVIAHNKLAIVVTKDGLRQYDYSNPADIRLLSNIGWAQ